MRVRELHVVADAVLIADKETNMKDISVIIPAYKPDEKLTSTISGLIDAGFNDIIVVDDGSGKQYEPIFKAVCDIPECTLLRHAHNKGKGAALKTAFAYFSDNRPNGIGVVTADADGQHLPKDIAAVSLAMAKRGDVVLGVRDFSDLRVPPRSRSGNRITSAVFRLFFGMKISDTQTGLRAFPRRFLPDIASAAGDRYEFETNMLFLMNKKRIPMSELGIETVYIEENRSSHFRVVRDSIRIYSLILKYLFSSCAASLIDILLFYLLCRVGVFNFATAYEAVFATVCARIVSSLVNYLLNSRVVFGERPSARTCVKYYILAAAVAVCSATCVSIAKNMLSLKSSLLVTLIKVLVDTVLFFVTFRFQHKWVFNTKGDVKQ